MPCTRAVKTAVFTVHGRVRAAYTAVIRSRTDHVRGPCTAVYPVCTRPWAAVYTNRKHGRVQGTRPCRCTLYTPWTHHVHGPSALARRCTRSVHAVNGRVHRHIHGTYTAVHTGRKHGRLHGRKHGRVHGHGRTMYTACAWPCTQSVHGCGWPCTDCARPPSAVYKLCTRPYTGHAHGPSVSRTRPCTQPVRGKTRPGSRPVPDRVRIVYTAVHGPCTVYTAVYTAVFTARIRGHVPCTCTCLRPVYTAVRGRVQTAYGPCTWSVHDPNAASAPTRPCLQPVPCTQPFTAYTDRVHHDTVHSRHRKS